MSYVSALVAGKMSPQDFVTKSAAELQRDLKFLSVFPGAVDWVVGALQGLLTSQGVSGTLAAIIVNAIRMILAPPAAPATPPSPPA